MSYTPGLLRLLSNSHDGEFRRWGYVGTDNLATQRGASWFSDGYKRGMRVGDLVEHMVVDDPYAITTCTRGLSVISAVNTSTGAATAGGLVTVT